MNARPARLARRAGIVTAAVAAVALGGPSVASADQPAHPQTYGNCVKGGLVDPSDSTLGPLTANENNLNQPAGGPRSGSGFGCSGF